VQTQAIEDTADCVRLVDGCQDPHPAAAAIASEGVHGEDTVE
jgi:hypothetical protein